MTFISKKPLLITCILFGGFISQAQDKALTKKYKKETIEHLSTLMNQFYVFPEVAKKTEAHLKDQFKSGHFKSNTDYLSFAKALTQSVQSINHDKHMRIQANPPFEAPEHTPERLVEEKINHINRSRIYNSGFNRVEIFDGNVGYLDLRGFARYENGKVKADAYMELLSNCDAIIIDLSKNGGGDPQMVQYLCSYFFNEKLLLNSLYWREGDRTEEFWTLDQVDGDKLPDIPLFVITGERTFSGAEEFSYNMQTRKRATLIGQTTGGGANPGGTMPINKDLHVFIPTGKAINPVTNTNWEGVGVIPEIKTSPEETLGKTKELAEKAAKDYRDHRKKEFKGLFLELTKSLQNPSTTNDKIRSDLQPCIEKNYLNEGDINQLGYQYFMEDKQPKIAEKLFKANTSLYPHSANAYDSYAEALTANGKLNEALKNYEKAVEYAEKNKDRNLELFKNNLNNLKKQIEAK